MLSHASIVGSIKDGTYTQTIISGNYFVVVELTGDTEKVNLELGRNIVSKIEEVISQTPEIEPIELVKIVKEGLGSDIHLSIIAAFIAGQKIILSVSGNIEAKLLRGDKVINLTAQSISGNLLHNDLVVFGTKELINKLSLKELKENRDVNEIREELLPKLEVDNIENATGLILKLELQEAPIVMAQEENVNTLDHAASPQPDEEVAQEAELLEVPNQEDQEIIDQANLDRLTPEPNTPPSWGKKSKLPDIFGSLSKLVPTRQNMLYLKQARENGFESAPHKKTLYFVVLAFVILLSVIAFQLRSRSLEVQAQSVANVEKMANDGIASTSKLIGLNDQLARESLEQKRTEVVEAIEKDFGSEWKNLKTKEGDRLRKAVAKIDSEIARAARINNVSKLTSFYDFSLLKDEAEISAAQIHEGTLVALDQKNGSVYSLGTENKSGTIVAGGNFSPDSSVDFYGDNLYVNTNDGIRQKNLTTSNSFRTVAKEASSAGKISGMASFANNLYLLDTGTNQIWKYLGTEEGGFSDPVTYIQPGIELNLGGAKGMVIDGFIYIFDEDRIIKFSQGAPQEIELKNLAMPLGSIDSLFASDEAENLYIWDGTNNRIVVIDKEGLYQAQYQLPTIKNPGEAIVLANEEVKKIFLISGGVVYGIDIK